MKEFLSDQRLVPVEYKGSVVHLNPNEIEDKKVAGDNQKDIPDITEDYLRDEVLLDCALFKNFSKDLRLKIKATFSVRTNHLAIIADPVKAMIERFYEDRRGPFHIYR